MKPLFERPVLVDAHGETARLSSPALLALMRAVLDRGKLFRFQAPGSSMYPFVRDGDILTLAPLRAAPRAGDILAFIHPARGNVVVHRAVQVAPAACRMRGDASPDLDDGWVPLDQILARVVRIQRGGRDIHMGLGPGRRLVAFLSARGWLVPLQASPLLRVFGKMILR